MELHLQFPTILNKNKNAWSKIKEENLLSAS
jgi:hypothetical protein